jgi:hypothetical protein
MMESREHTTKVVVKFRHCLFPSTYDCHEEICEKYTLMSMTSLSLRTTLLYKRRERRDIPFFVSVVHLCDVPILKRWVERRGKQ